LQKEKAPDAKNGRDQTAAAGRIKNSLERYGRRIGQSPVPIGSSSIGKSFEGQVSSQGYCQIENSDS
jgi:hypothetical protein